MLESGPRPERRARSPAPVTTVRVSSLQPQLCQHQQSTCRLQASPVCSSAAPLRLSCSTLAAGRVCPQKQAVAGESPSADNICDINAGDSSSMFLGLLGQIKADSRKGESVSSRAESLCVYQEIKRFDVKLLPVVI